MDNNTKTNTKLTTDFNKPTGYKNCNTTAFLVKK
jgi:hypothetical protein